MWVFDFFLSYRFEDAEYLHYANDKAPGGQLAQIISFFDPADKTQGPDGSILKHIVEFVKSGNTSKQVADAARHTTRETLALPEHKVFSSVSFDSGGGTGVSGMAELKNAGLLADFHFKLACTMHTANIDLSYPYEKVFGLPGLGKNNSLQCLHSMYDLQSCFPRKDWRKLWEVASSDELKCLIVECKLSRWLYTGEAAAHAVTKWDDWKKVVELVIKLKHTTYSHHKIACGIYALMREDEIATDIRIILAYWLAYLGDHMKWIQGVDKGGCAGFKSLHMLLRSFLMAKDLDNLEENWSAHPKFSPVVEVLNGLDEELADIERDKIRHLFVVCKANRKKHWDAWRKDLLIFGACGEYPFGVIVARWMKGGEFCNQDGAPKLDGLPDSFNSEIQGSKSIKLKEFADFLQKDIDIDAVREESKALMQRFDTELTVIAKGSDMWHNKDADTWDQLSKMCIEVLKLIGASASNNQESERAVKKVKKEAAIRGRSEQTYCNIGVVGDFFNWYKKSHQDHLIVKLEAAGLTAEENPWTGTEQCENDLNAETLDAETLDDDDAEDNPRTREVSPTKIRRRRTKQRVRGALRLEGFLDGCVFLDEKLTELEKSKPDFMERKAKIEASMMEEGCYENKKLESFMNEVTAAALTDLPTYAAMKGKGVDRTTLVDGKVLFFDVASKCRAPPHLENLQGELAHREVSFGATETIKTLKDKLKVHEKARWLQENPSKGPSDWDKRSFVALTGREKFLRPGKYAHHQEDFMSLVAGTNTNDAAAG